MYVCVFNKEKDRKRADARSAQHGRRGATVVYRCVGWQFAAACSLRACLTLSLSHSRAMPPPPRGSFAGPFKIALSQSSRREAHAHSCVCVYI